jgi:DNA polymerase (family 10)
MTNATIADIFDKIADMLEFKGEIPFKVNAYRKASRVIRDLPDDIKNVWEQGRLIELPGIGEALVKKIDEFIRTGKISKYEELAQSIPADLMQLLRIQNLGPKTLALAHEKLQVNNLTDLQHVIANGSLAKLPGMGPKKVENIQKGIQFYLSAQARIPLGIALPLIEEIIKMLEAETVRSKISPAGSLRRMKETVGDLDLLIGSSNAAPIIDKFVHLPQVDRVIAAGETKASINLMQGYQVDLRVVGLDSFGAALQYFTGSQAHNIKIRGLAKKQGLKINEYGIFRDEVKLAGTDEEEIYHTLGMDWIPPEMREDRGEIELALQKQLPRLVSRHDIQGDLHIHSNYSDGHASIESMVQQARQLGYSYLAICDHSQAARYAHGLVPERLALQWQEIDQLNRSNPEFKILKGIEVDILPDGTLDFPDEILSQCDLVIAAIHSSFTKDPTARIIQAMQNPFVDIIAHPTGRIISQREGYVVDLDLIFQQALKSQTALEINCHPERLDLSDLAAKKASEMGIMLALNTDAHSPDGLLMIKYGLGSARRSWLTAAQLLNTMDSDRLQQWLRQRKSKG